MTERTLSPDHAPLNHVEIVITRASHQNQQISQQFRDLGAEVILAPTIKFVDPPPSGDSRYDRGSWMIPERDVMKTLWRFDWVIFTSVNAVLFAEKTWLHAGGIRGALKYTPSGSVDQKIRAPKVACVGSSTQRALSTLQVSVDLIPQDFHAEGLLSVFQGEGVEGSRILIPRALEARELLPEALRIRGGEVWICPLYQTVTSILNEQVKRQLIAPVRENRARALLFTSNSTIMHLIEQMSEPYLNLIRERCYVYVIGPVVKRAALRYGFKVRGVALPHTIEGLISCVHADLTES